VAFLRTTRAQLRRLINPDDRAHLSRPIVVTEVYCELSTRYVIVRDDVRGVTFAVQPASLVPSFAHLTTREQHAVIDHAMRTYDAGVCGAPIDAAIEAPCERARGHLGPCRAYSLEGDRS